MEFELGIIALDNIVNESARELWHDKLNDLIMTITHLGGEASVIASFIVFSIYFGLRKEFKMVRFYLTALFGGILLFSLFKVWIGRDRPITKFYDVAEYSFPSGHATIAAILAWFVYLVFAPRLSSANRTILMILCSSYALGISMTRVYLNVHYLSDVIAGMALATAWMVFLSKYYLQYEAKISTV